MNITSLVELIDGELKNPPSISFVHQFHTDINKLKNGDLFISNEQSQINKAVSIGAFAIVYESDFINICDKEIAWIKVKNIENAIVKLTRYLLANLDIKVFYAKLSTIDIIKLSSTEQNTYSIFDDNIYLNLFKAQNIYNKHTILCANKGILKDVYPTFEIFNIQQYNLENITIHSIFETTFSHNGILYARTKVPFYLVDTFLSVLSYLKIQDGHDIVGIRKWNLLNPIFINKTYKPIEFGKSDRFIITTKTFEYAMEQLLHIQQNYTYGKVTILVSSKYAKSLKNSTIFENIEDLEFYIKNLQYNLLYIIGSSNQEIIDILEKPLQQDSLFD
ncbi:hypothetical protein [Arcobacter sp. FWKO B]|uniref:hypothetical protein n=1 Tax=Arcobacter sp. FWKO B TaxID=2593672 RepID=UPI0018A33C5C|nr:hypothetical protein [Arcobacter sp. FWKO B]QOG11347.1 hypothetical protein FWKOB_00955 [Arcobacter sp. FWKO B]